MCMKARRILGLAVVASLVFILVIGGCASGRPNPDPLAGWKEGTSALEGNPYAKTITDDCAEYIRKLPDRERKFVKDYNTWFYEDGTGKHAVRIALAYDGNFWDH